jgi:hypothetical protein
VSRLDRGSLAVFADIVQRQIELCLCAENSVFETDLYPGFDIVAAISPLPTALAAAEKITEYITQTKIAEVKIDILSLAAEALEAFERITRAATVSSDPGVAELIIALALLGVLQYFVRFVDFFELRFVTPLFVGVQLYRLASEGFLDFVGTGALSNA